LSRVPNHESDSHHSDSAAIGSPAKLIHEILPVGLLQCNCHILGDPATHEAVVIDPGDDVESILEVIARHRLKVRAILITHTHIDHVGGLKKIREATGASVLMHEADLLLYQALEMQAQWIRWPTPDLAEVDGFLSEGKSVRWGNYDLRVLHTPGHTEGSVCLYLPHNAGAILSADATRASGASHEPGLLFAGDTLFEGSIGRTDLWGGSMKEIMRSLKTKVLALPDDTIVFPGHGAATTIGIERETNQFLQGM
jgi:glyoxylase-like metal-dependent hydrolase (beta-lactamase superfamily II)